MLRSPLPPIAAAISFIDCVDRGDLGGLTELMTERAVVVCRGSMSTAVPRGKWASHPAESLSGRYELAGDHDDRVGHAVAMPPGLRAHPIAHDVVLRFRAGSS